MTTHGTSYPTYKPEQMTKWELLEIIRTIDIHVPRSDETCDEPGITISEAVFRQLYDVKQQMRQNEA